MNKHSSNLKTIGLRHLKHGKSIYSSFAQKSLKISTNISSVCGIHHYCSIFWKSLFLKLKKGKHSKVANFAVKKKICVLDRLHFHSFMQCKLAM